jgi:hypothetical protein
MHVTYDPNRQVTLSGSLSSSSGPIANQTISFGGVFSGTTTTNAQGNYSIKLTAESLGQVTASCANGLSNTARSTLVDGKPTINNFAAVSLGGGMWEFTGTVTGAPSQGEVVNFGILPALQGEHVNVNQNGSFTLYCYIPSGQGGTASATAVDWWGDTSAVSGAYVNC